MKKDKSAISLLHEMRKNADNRRIKYSYIFDSFFLLLFLDEVVIYVSAYYGMLQLTNIAKIGISFLLILLGLSLYEAIDAKKECEEIDNLYLEFEIRRKK